jgi:hypothetical protein
LTIAYASGSRASRHGWGRNLAGGLPQSHYFAGKGGPLDDVRYGSASPLILLQKSPQIICIIKTCNNRIAALESTLRIGAQF